jgi:hypothetical protein
VGRAMRRVLQASFVATMVVMMSGCCEFDRFVHSPFGPGTLCDPTHCGACGCDPCECGPCDTVSCAGPCGRSCYGGFGPSWGCGPANCCEPQCGPGAGCGDACGLTSGCGTGCGCGNACGCGPCGDECPGGCTCGCCGPGPLYYAARLFHPLRWFGCYNNGCGEMYWGDFHGDPPDCCDPCDRMGNFTGSTSGVCGGGCRDCGCGGGAPAENYGTPAQASPTRALPDPQAGSDDGVDPSRVGEPTKAPVIPSKAGYYTSSRRPQQQMRRQPQQQARRYPQQYQQYPYRDPYQR